MQEMGIKLFWPAIPSKEDVLRDIEQLLWPKDGTRPFIGEGSLVDKFEAECCDKFGFDYVLYVNSGTAALDLALMAANVSAGDEVISSPLTCTATNTAIMMRQAKPVFTDVQYETANIEPLDIEHRVTDKTKAIMVVHWGGYPCDMDEINAIASKYGLPVIADGAHALGATYKGRPISKTADFTMFSLQSIKQMTTVDGGLLAITLKRSKPYLIRLSKEQRVRTLLRVLFGKLLSNYFKENIQETKPPADMFVREMFDSLKANTSEQFCTEITRDYEDFKQFWADWQMAESVRRRRWFGIGRDERIPSPEKGYSAYPTFEVGGKLHANNLGAIIGLASLKKIDMWAKRRKEIVERYNSQLRGVPGVNLFKQDIDRQSGNWLYNIHVENRDRFILTLGYKGIETSIAHERNDIIPLFRPFAKGPYPKLDRVNEDRVCIPLHQNLSDEEVEYVISAIKAGW